jgi:hypothetical protein
MRPQKGKITSWIIFVIFIVVIFGLLIFLQSKQEAAEKATVGITKTVTKVTKPRKKFAVPEVSEEQKKETDKKAFNDALLTGKGCENIKYDPELKQTCLDTLAYNDAIQKKDETLCEKIVDSELKTKCYDQIYLGVAIANSDTKFCDKITDSDTKQNCLDQLLALSGRTLKSADECNVIKDSSLKQICLDNFYYENSINNMSEDGCSKIQDKELRERCESTIEKKAGVAESTQKQIVRTYQTTEEKLQECGTLTGEAATDCKDEANFNLALEKKDISYCNSIVDSSSKASCIEVNSTSINNFYLKQATFNNDPTLCNKILDSELRSSCASYFQ